MKKLMFGLLCVSLLIIISAMNVYGAEQSFSWYCKRNKTHNQPTVDGQMQNLEKYGLVWCDKEHRYMDDEDKIVYLTFDAGYENGNICKILKILEKENVKATFFVLDNLIYKNSELVQKMIDDGHVVANHTMKHKDMTKMKTIDEFEKELKDLEELYRQTFNAEMPHYYRPPEGKFNINNLKWANELGYKTVMWSFAYADWDNGKQPSTDYAIKKILENLHNGEVMLLHPTSTTNAEIMSELIQRLKSEGFRFGTVEELCEK